MNLVEFHMDRACAAAGGISGVAELVDHLIALKARSDVPERVIRDLANDCVLASLATALHFAANALTNHLEFVDARFESAASGISTDGADEAIDADNSLTENCRHEV